MTRYIVELAISADELRRLYAGTANIVIARDRISGHTVRFPAGNLRPFVTAAGVFGQFELRVDGANRLQDIRSVGKSASVNTGSQSTV